MTSASTHFVFDNSYAHELDGFYVSMPAAKAPQPELVKFNQSLAAQLGLNIHGLDGEGGAQIFSGNIMPDGAEPLAQAYAGHQFGHFSPQLGDGRALLMGEIIDRNGKRFDIHLKGSGRTPFSRGGDGKAVLGPVLREYLMGEAMHGLGIPTTRALAAVTTGEEIQREGWKIGAVLTRIASSHLRVGTFQFFASRGDWEKVQRLSDYAIARHDPDLTDAEDGVFLFFQRVAKRQARLIAQWMQVGFIHGVMNTDNMTISGETIDYGPCAFMDGYNPATVFSSIDRHGRYAYGNQPVIGQWNLARLAETFIPLIDPDNDQGAIDRLMPVVEAYMAQYETSFYQGMGTKIGFENQKPGDRQLIDELLKLMERRDVDFTSFFRTLATAAKEDNTTVSKLFDDTEFKAWLSKWRQRLSEDARSSETITAAMNRINPIYIPRNHLVEEALAAAENEGNYAPFEHLLEALADPFTKRDGFERYEAPAPADFAPYRTFCGT